MRIEKFVVGPLENNAYLVINDVTKSAILIDAPKGSKRILDYIEDNGLTLDSILLTHGHFDHIADVSIFEKLSPKVYLHEADLFKINEPDYMAKMMGIEVLPFNVDYVIKQDETIKVNGYNVKVICTPGHTRGCVVYIIDNVMFSGDTLFRCSYGRYDFEDSSFKDLKESLEKIFNIEGDYRVLPGHADETLLSFERANNPMNY